MSLEQQPCCDMNVMERERWSAKMLSISPWTYYTQNQKQCQTEKDNKNDGEAVSKIVINHIELGEKHIVEALASTPVQVVSVYTLHGKTAVLSAAALSSLVHTHSPSFGPQSSVFLWPASLNVSFVRSRSKWWHVALLSVSQDPTKNVLYSLYYNLLSETHPAYP